MLDFFSVSLMLNIQMLIGTGGIFVFEQIVRRALAKADLKLPSSLVSMVCAFILLKVISCCCLLLHLWFCSFCLCCFQFSCC